MKNITKLFAAFIILGCQGVYGQASLDTLMNIVTDNNKQLKAAAAKYEADVLASRVGNSPPNPEVEYGYMWGDPSSQGNRVDFSITQSFDFPTAYTRQSQLRKITSEQASLKQSSERQEIMARTKKSWIEAVYLNGKINLLRQRMENAEQVYAGFLKKYETGEASQLQKNQAFLKLTVLKNEINLTRTALQNNSNAIKNLAGGIQVIIEDSLLPMPAELILDSLLADYREGVNSQWYDSEIDKRMGEQKVIFNKKLPQMMAGYYSESIPGISLKGVKAGISIPLWGNAHAVNRAKAGVVFAEHNAWQFKAQQSTQISNLYARWDGLCTQVEELIEAVHSTNNEALLMRSLEEGEISLTEYFYESDFFFQSRLLILESWRDLLKIEADLQKIYY